MRVCQFRHIRTTEWVTLFSITPPRNAIPEWLALGRHGTINLFLTHSRPKKAGQGLRYIAVTQALACLQETRSLKLAALKNRSAASYFFSADCQFNTTVKGRWEKPPWRRPG